MAPEVITSQPTSNNHVTSTVSDEPPSYEEVISIQPTVTVENPLNAGLDSVQNTEEAETKTRNRRHADDCCFVCCVSDDNDDGICSFFANCCINIAYCTDSCCQGCADCLHNCCESNTEEQLDDNGCCSDCCNVGDSGGNNTDCCSGGDSGCSDMDCNCFD